MLKAERYHYNFKKSYSRLPGTWRPGGKQTVIIVCPTCETNFQLTNAIGAAGLIDGEVSCPKCDFHEFAYLVR